MSYYQVDTQVKLADKLGISTTTLSNWKSRNTVDWVLLFTKCEDINLNWLIRGEGSMLRGEDVVGSDAKQSTAPKPMSNSELVEYLQRRLDDKMREVFDLETKVNNLEREKKAQGTSYYATAADKVVKYGREEK